MAPNQPFFSRRQLNLVIAVSAIVIALLSIPTESWPTIQRHSLQPSVLQPAHAFPQPSLTSIVDPDQTPELRLLFALPQPGLLPQPPAQLLMRLLQQRLQQRQVAGLALKPVLHGDRISLSITADSAAAFTQHLPALVPLLTEPFEQAVIRRAIKYDQAQRHISRNQQSTLDNVDRWLRQQRSVQPQKEPQQNDPITVTANDINQLQQRLFSRQQLQLSLIGPTPESIDAALSKLLDQLPTGQAWPVVTDTLATAPSPQQTHDSLIAISALQPLAGRQSRQFPQTLLLSRIIEQLAPERRIRLHPGADTSWLIWLSPTATAEPQPLVAQPLAAQALAAQIDQIKQRLASMRDWELERAADDLREQLEQHLRQPQALANQLEVIAFYRLPVDYLPQLEATIAALSGALIRQQLQDLLQPERFSYPQPKPG